MDSDEFGPSANRTVAGSIGNRIGSRDADSGISGDRLDINDDNNSNHNTYKCNNIDSGHTKYL